MPDMNLKAIPVMKQALEAIQELHPWNRLGFCKVCQAFYCETRRLADRGLEGDHG